MRTRDIVLIAMLALCLGCRSDKLFRAGDKFNGVSQNLEQRGSQPQSYQVQTESLEPESDVVLVDYKEPLQSPSDSSLELRSAIGQALGSLDTVRVSDGGKVEASPITFYDLEVSKTRIDAALADFDATFAARIFGNDIRKPPNAFFGPGLAEPLVRDEAGLNFLLKQKMASGGTGAIGYTPLPGYFFLPTTSTSAFNPTHTSELQFSWSQPLLRDAGRAVNMIPLQISRIGVDQTAWELKKTVSASVRSVVSAYWELYAAGEAVKELQEVLPLIEEVKRLQDEAFKTGWVVQADVAKAEAQLHDYRQRLLETQSAQAGAELRLRNLMGLSPNFSRVTELTTMPTTSRPDYERETLLEEAMSNQPDLVKRRLDIRIRQLELAGARNQMKPNLNFETLYRMNGVGESLGSALDQMATADFADWELGAGFSAALGRRAARANVRAADNRLMRDSALLEQQCFTVYHDLANALRRLDFLEQQLQEGQQSLKAARAWVSGARLRYQNPNPEGEGGNWLLENLNDYLNAIRFQTDVATTWARNLAEFNIQLARIEEIKGTILEFYGIDFPADPCHQAKLLKAAEEELPWFRKLEATVGALDNQFAKRAEPVDASSTPPESKQAEPRVPEIQVSTSAESTANLERYPLERSQLSSRVSVEVSTSSTNKTFGPTIDGADLTTNEFEQERAPNLRNQVPMVKPPTNIQSGKNQPERTGRPTVTPMMPERYPLGDPERLRLLSRPQAPGFPGSNGELPK